MNRQMRVARENGHLDGQMRYIEAVNFPRPGLFNANLIGGRAFDSVPDLDEADAC